ncbi:MAG: YheT family hydrolase, partial [Verrucomicrobiota bacterium]
FADRRLRACWPAVGGLGSRVPIVDPSSYQPPRLLQDGHAQTLFAAVSRRVRGVEYTRQRIETDDGDFLDVDWIRQGGRRLVILSHGLEGDSRRPYMRGMARAFRRRGWDVAAWNARGSSGEDNRTLRFTHSGATDDLATVVRAALAPGGYEAWALVGFSLGGNLTLKYLGERGEDVPPGLVGGVAFSVPCDLDRAARRMAERSNRFYMRRFLGDLAERIRRKAVRFPGQVDAAPIAGMRSFHEFDERYTAPLHGFRDAADYYARSSSLAYLRGIRVRTLLVNAVDDPFLTPECLPYEVAAANGFLHLETPEKGGHVGFVSLGTRGEYWSERRATAFLQA